MNVMKETLAQPDRALYTRVGLRTRMLKTSTQEKHELIRRFASGELSSQQIGQKLVDLDRKNRTKKVVFLSSCVGLLTLILAPFLVFVGHAGPSGIHSSRQ